MTVIRPNSISGINSITAQSGALNFYDSAGATLSIGASVTGNITGNVTGNLTGNVNSTGVSTLGNTIVGGATTQLVVNGDARITGILTVGTASVTFNGTNNTITVGTGVTIFGNTGIVSATEFRGNGANLTGVEANGALRSVQYYTSSGSATWTKPAGLKRVRVYVTGGGGGGGNPAANTNNSGGGAGGGTAIKVIATASLGATETVTVGSGGNNGNPGGTGGTSSFGSHCSATGGVGGSSDSSQGAYVSPGVGSNGDLNIKGNGPDAGRPAGDNGVGGSGGGSFWGGGGNGGFNYGYPHAGSGSHGGGGGGAYRTGAGAAGGGANGGTGVVVVEEYF